MILAIQVALKGRLYEELIRERDHRRGHRTHRKPAAHGAAPVGKDGCGADDGALFRRARHGVGKTESSAHADWQDHWVFCEANLHEREALLSEQSHRQETRHQRCAGLWARAGTAQDLCAGIPPGRRSEVYASPTSVLWSIDSHRVESRYVQTPRPSPAAVRSLR